GGVRIEQMDPGEPGGSRRTLDPREGGFDDLLGSALREMKTQAFGPRLAIIVDVEIVCETEPGIEDERPHERAGAVAGSFEKRRQRRHRVVQPKRRVVADAMSPRDQTGED